MQVETQDKSERINFTVWSSSYRKLEKMAEIERRSLVGQMDVIVDEALRARNIDPVTLEPLNKNATR